MNRHPPTQSPDAAETETARRGEARRALAAVRSGDTEAYGQFVALYEARIMSLCLALMRNTGVAEELAQDVFVRAYRYLDSLDDARPIYPWLAKIAYRLAQTRWQRERREAALRAEAGEQLSSDRGAEGPLAAAIADEEARRLWRAVHALPQGERAAAVLYYRDGMDVRGVADVLGVSTGTVKTFLFRARKRLHAMLLQRDAAQHEGPER